MRFLLPSYFALALLACAGGASATTVDPAGDFLSTYTGPLNGDLDLLDGGVTFDGTSFNFSSTVNGPVGSTVGSLYVWGIDRGAGSARLALGTPSVGSAVLFDSVVVMFPDGTLRVVTFPVGGPPVFNILLGGTVVSGNLLSANVPLSLLPTTGFAPADYAFTLWSRDRVDPAMDGTNAEIADFLPNVSSLRANVVPEPATWLSMLLGFGLIGHAMRRRRVAQKAVGKRARPA